jgi:N utilization substance protein A
VVAELAGEKIDVIPWNDDPAVFVANALSPAQVLSVDIDDEKRIASVTVPERMLSLAIGREGQNARLAARLTGWRIDIRSDVSVAEAKAAAESEEQAAPAEAEAVAAESDAPSEPVAPAAEAAEAPAENAPDAPAEAVPAKPKRTRTKKAAAATNENGAGDAADAATAEATTPGVEAETTEEVTS